MVRGPGKSALGAVIAGYKAAVTRDINGLSGVGQVAIWQRNYYEHVIRNDEDLRRIREYIVNDPARWSDDRYYIQSASAS
jgi:REP element-mobilizing transposase RayT